MPVTDTAVPATIPAIPGVPSPVLCRNMMSGPTVIAANNKGDHEVIFAGAGDPAGGDVQPIPAELLAQPQFAKAIRQEVLTIVAGEENPYVAAALARQTGAFRARADREREEALAVLDTPSKDDMIVVECMGPGPREGTECGEEIPVRASLAAAQPPLCSRHAHLAENCLKRGNGPWQLEADGALVPRVPKAGKSQPGAARAAQLAAAVGGAPAGGAPSAMSALLKDAAGD